MPIILLAIAALINRHAQAARHQGFISSSSWSGLSYRPNTDITVSRFPRLRYWLLVTRLITPPGGFRFAMRRAGFHWRKSPATAAKGTET